MSLFSMISVAVFAAESVLSPIPDEAPGIAGSVPGQPIVEVRAPFVSFGALAQTVGLPHVLSASTDQKSSPPDELHASNERDASTSKVKRSERQRRVRKNAFTIAVIGDSMVDTLGPDVPHLRNKLTRWYPGVSLRILNYGVAATNIDYGVRRLTNDYDYVGKHTPSLVSQKPDIVVIESFGYNPFPFDTEALDKHWLALAYMVDTIKGNLPDVKIVIAATIAPNWEVFGDGAAGVAFSATAKQEHATVIKGYLENALRFAKSQGLPYADAFHPSMDASGNGKLVYINSGDHIHYSDAGRDLFAKVLAQTIVANKLFE